MPHSTRPNSEKYEKILEALRTLLETKKISQISVSEIAQTAGIGKGSIYYYFSSKEAIFDALMAKSYEEPLATAKELAKRSGSAVPGMEPLSIQCGFPKREK